MTRKVRGVAFQSRIITGDVIATLRAQPSDVKFDVVIADPPYNIGKDFGVTQDSMDLADYVQWCDHWLRECFRLLAGGGLIYVYGVHEVLAHLAVRHPIGAQRWLAWHYTNKAVPSSKFWQRAHEGILCLWTPEQERPSLEID